MQDTIGRVLGRLLAERNESHNAFAARTGTSQTTISLVVKDKRPPPLKMIAKWADALALAGAERERFVTLGRSAKAKRKADGREYVAELEAELALLRVEVDQLRQVIRAAGIPLPRRRRSG